MRLLSTLIFVVIFGFVKAQEVSVDPNLFGVQFGTNGISVHGEFKLTPLSTLRAELALTLGALINNNDIDFYLFPLIAVESRRYYNLAKRQSIGKNTYKNSANFYSLLIYYQPRKFTSRGNQRIRFSEATSIYARWGLKRVYGKHFTMETAVGPGIILYNLSSDKRSIFNINIDFRIGYTF